MSLGNFPLFLSTLPDLEDSEGLDVLNGYQLNSVPTNQYITGGNITTLFLSGGTFKMMFVVISGFSANNNSGSPQTFLLSFGDLNTNFYTTNAYSLIKTKTDTNPIVLDNEETGIFASGTLVPYNGSENTVDTIISNLISWNNTLQLTQDAKSYLSNNIPAIYTQNLFLPIADNPAIPNEEGEGLQIGIYTGPSYAYDNTFHPEVNDSLAYDYGSNRALWIPENDLIPDENAVQLIKKGRKLWSEKEMLHVKNKMYNKSYYDINKFQRNCISWCWLGRKV
jgi:ligand-binding sensor protein